MTLQKELSTFDVVGHFHLKGTKELEKVVLNQWQEFLYESLIGKQGEIANQLFFALKNNSKIGLVFPEDPTLLNWGKNRDLTNKLLKDIGVTGHTPDTIEYPTGNMFWARPKALAPLLSRNWEWSDFPAEPVPYDGSILHAIERAMPLVCEHAGFEWATVHNLEVRRYFSI